MYCVALYNWNTHVGRSCWGCRLLYLFVDGRLFYVGPNKQYMRLVVLTEEEKRSALVECHNNHGTGNHHGVRGTRDRVIAGYFWSTLKDDVTKWVRYNCLLARTNNVNVFNYSLCDYEIKLAINNYLLPQVRHCQQCQFKDPRRKQAPVVRPVKVQYWI